MKIFDQNDFKSYFNSGKNKRVQTFEKETFWILQMDYGVEIEGFRKNETTFFIINSKRFGKVMFYPKSNRLLITKSNTWLNNGLQFIITNFAVMKIRNKHIENRIKALKIGVKFKAVNCGRSFKLRTIIDRQGGKKLSDPLYVWEYIEDPEKTFTNKTEDIRRALLYKSWI